MKPRFADLDGVRESLVHRANVGEPAAGRDEGEWSTGLAAVEEQTRVLTRPLGALLGLAVEIVKHRSTDGRIVDHSIQRRDDDRGIDMGVIREECADLPERQRGVIAAVIPRQQQTAEASERRMLQDVADAMADSVSSSLQFHGRLRRGQGRRDDGYQCGQAMLANRMFFMLDVLRRCRCAIMATQSRRHDACDRVRSFPQWRLPCMDRTSVAARRKGLS